VFHHRPRPLTFLAKHAVPTPGRGADERPGREEAERDAELVIPVRLVQVRPVRSAERARGRGAVFAARNVAVISLAECVDEDLAEQLTLIITQRQLRCGAGRFCVHGWYLFLLMVLAELPACADTLAGSA
jgi:hypothetical protein